MVGLTFSTTAENWRRLGHLIADAIYERLTGEKGYFDTRIVFIAESGPKTKRRYRLSIMDQDGANPSFLTGGDYIVLSPRFSPTQQAITYMSYEKAVPSVFVFDLQTGQREVIGQYSGMTFAPRFTPDGNRVVFSYSRDNNIDIYVADLRSRRPTRLTADPGIDTLAIIRTGRHEDRIQLRSRRLTAALCDERRRFEPEPSQLRARALHDAGVVAARRSHRLHEAIRRDVRDRRDAARRFRRARLDAKLFRRGTDVVAERTRHHVHAHNAWSWRRWRSFLDLVDRSDRAQRAARHHAGRSLRSGMVAFEPVRFLTLTMRIRVLLA